MTTPRRTRQTPCPSPPKTENSDFRWGSPTQRPKDVATTLGLRYYRSFKWKNQKYRVDDFVLIDNGGEDGEGRPFVARLEELSDISDSRKDVNYQGKVTWYARPEELDGRKLGREIARDEVILLMIKGKRAHHPFVDLETICGLCNVVFVGEQVSSCPPEDKNGRPQYFCRYTWNERTLRPLLSPGTKTRNTPKERPVRWDLGEFRDPIVRVERLEDCKELETGASPKKSRPIRLKRTDKENFEIISSPMKTPSKKVLKAPDTVEKLARNLKGVSLANQQTPLKATRNGATESVCTPKSSKIERTSNARPRRSVRTLFSPEKNPEPPKNEGELTDTDLISEEDYSDTSTEIEHNSSSSSSSEFSEDNCSSDDEPRSRGRVSKKSGRGQSSKKTPKAKSVAKQSAAPTPSMPTRKAKTRLPQTDIERALSKLHVCAVPDQLPCRGDQFAEIYDFVESRLIDQVGSCMYISGVPGTGKTATVREVIRALQDSKDAGDVPEFKFIEINGMKLSEPNQAYVQILRQLNGQKATADSAADILTSIFKSKRKSSDAMTVLLVDELDLLWTRKQQVLYNIFDWPTNPNSRLVVVAIANTMDLPERMVMNKVASRMGLSRMTFQPYTFQELQEIVKARLSGLELMDPDAVQFISRKVAALSGDARRALDVCRRAVELSESRGDVQVSPSKRAKKYAVTMAHVNEAVKEMFTSSKIVAMQALSFHEKLALRAIVAEFRRTGVEECVFHRVSSQYCTLARLEGAAPVKATLLSRLLAKMASSRLLILSDPRHDFQQKISLNATADDVNFALRETNDSDE